MPKSKWPLQWIVLLSLMLMFVAPGLASAQTVSAQDIPVVITQNISAGGETQFGLLFKNNTAASHQYQLSTEALPADCQALFILEGQSVNQLKIQPGQCRALQLKIKASQSAAAGTKYFNVLLKRDDGRVFLQPLALTVNKDYALSITSRQQGLTALSGQSVQFPVSVANTGAKALQQIQLKFDLPHKWVVQQVSPKTLALNPGGEDSFQVQLLVPSSQAAGNEKVQVTAVAKQADSTPATVPVQVQKNPSYLLWAILGVLLAGLATAYYFRKHGRR